MLVRLGAEGFDYIVNLGAMTSSAASDCKTLDELWARVEQVNRTHFPDNILASILGDGQVSKPKAMFVFINPTVRNVSSDLDWQGPRFPFIGTKQVWRIFYRAGLFDSGLMQQIEDMSDWSVEFTGKVLKFLQGRGLYLTNIVKWTGRDSTLPGSDKIRLFLPILEKEIELVQPQYIVTLGLIPFESLAGRKIRLGDYHSEVMRTGELQFYDLAIGSTDVRVVPSFFPVGRGDPKRAVDILKLVADL